MKWFLAVVVGVVAALTGCLRETDPTPLPIEVTIEREAAGAVEIEIRPAGGERARTGTYCEAACRVSARPGDEIAIYATTPSHARIEGECAAEGACTFVMPARGAEVRVSLEPLPRELWTYVTDLPVTGVAYDGDGRIVATTGDQKITLSANGELIASEPTSELGATEPPEPDALGLDDDDVPRGVATSATGRMAWWSDPATYTVYDSDGSERWSFARGAQRDSWYQLGPVTRAIAIGATDLVVAGALVGFEGEERGFVQVFAP